MVPHHTSNNLRVFTEPDKGTMKNNTVYRTVQYRTVQYYFSHVHIGDLRHHRDARPRTHQTFRFE